MWWLCAVSALLLSRPPPPAAGATCDDDPSDIQLDLPDEDVYTCTEDYIPLSHQVLPSISSRYEQENSSHVCMNTAIVYVSAIPNSGAHRPIMAKYGEYIFCPPQQWVHNLKRGGVAFLYHPCVHPKLKEALSLLARRSMAKHIITPLHTLSRDRPLALAAWCSTLEMSHINRTEVIGWLRDNVHIEHQTKTGGEGSYQHLLIRPSVMTPGDSSKHLRVLNYFASKGSQLRRQAVKKRRRRSVLRVTPLVQETTVYNVSRSSVSTPAGSQTGKLYNNQNSISKTSVSANIHSLPDPVTPGPPVYLPQETTAERLKADIQSRELGEHVLAERADLPASNEDPPPENITPGLSGLNLGHSIRENASEELSHRSAGTQHADFHDSKQSKVSVDTVLLPTPTPQTRGKSTDKQLLPSEKPVIDSKGQKPDCECQQDPQLQLTAKAQRRLGVNRQKNSEVFVSTPRTEEAKWAVASLSFLFALLTFSVLYTQIYKKFRKSQSLYWTSGSHLDEESVASVIKRRLVQGHSIRKKWIGRKKSPVVLYESLSDSSD
ncbi:tumor protein p53-inducible protein 13 isoform X1 [Bufo bufo]|uniref:tumor protein p53-inducible protein 13 isoform X1 n=1 Tax=Bufo bufo TaxID=8384 RepID=UPI001ABDCD71|nr:tumor protein p53-inducible protein 13 isoform X1 [Bufo bufo]